jgi:hypothetical protein
MALTRKERDSLVEQYQNKSKYFAEEANSLPPYQRLTNLRHIYRENANLYSDLSQAVSFPESHQRWFRLKCAHAIIQEASELQEDVLVSESKKIDLAQLEKDIGIRMRAATELLKNTEEKGKI